MNRLKYKYDPDKLNYSKLNQNFRSKFFKVFSWVMGSLVLAILFNIGYASFFDTPREKQVRQENKILTESYITLMEKFITIDTVLKEVRNTDENLYRTIFETEPVFINNVESFENSKAYFDLLRLENKMLVKLTTDKVGSILNTTALQTPEYRNLLNLSTQKKDMLINIPAIQPVYNKDLSRIASGYGIKVHPNYKIKKFHYGMDFIAPKGTEIYATGGGIVENLERTRRGHGNTVTIFHGFGYKTKYSYLENFNVKFGQKVKRGDVIGWVGFTELSIAPHLHYEVLLNDKPVNPVNYFFLELNPREYNRIVLLAAKTGQSFD